MLPFKLKLPGTDRVSGGHATSTSFRVRGFLLLEGDLLTIQWGGEVQVQEVSPLSIQDDREVLPDERFIVPVGHLSQATLAGGWWRPRLTLRAQEPGALGEVPSEELGAVQFWYARGDRTAALSMAAALNEAIAWSTKPAAT